MTALMTQHHTRCCQRPYRCGAGGWTQCLRPSHLPNDRCMLSVRAMICHRCRSTDRSYWLPNIGSSRI